MREVRMHRVERLYHALWGLRLGPPAHQDPDGIVHGVCEGEVMGKQASFFEGARLQMKGGWRLMTSEGKDPYFRIRKGLRYWKFLKRLEDVGR